MPSHAAPAPEPVHAAAPVHHAPAEPVHEAAPVHVPAQDAAAVHESLDVTGIDTSTSAHVVTAPPAVHEAVPTHLASLEHSAPVEHVGLSGPVGVHDDAAFTPFPDHSVIDATVVDPPASEDDGLWSQATDSVEGVLDDIGNALDDLF